MEIDLSHGSIWKLTPDGYQGTPIGPDFEPCEDCGCPLYENTPGVRVGSDGQPYCMRCYLAREDSGDVIDGEE